MKRITLLVAAMVVALAAPAAVAAPKPPVFVKVERAAALVNGGQGVEVRLSVACSTGLEVLEANLSASQDDASGFTGFGGVVCDGRRHTHRVTVTSFGGTFERGVGFASAFVLVIDPATQTTQQGQDSRNIRIR